jgi:hypothetical protein
MNRVLICTQPQNYMPARVQEALAYLLRMSGATEDERRLASEAIEWLRSKRDEPKPEAEGEVAPQRLAARLRVPPACLAAWCGDA